MISCRNILRFVLQDFLLKKKISIVILGFIPFLFVLTVLFSNAGKTLSSVEELILWIRFEFFYNPLFILLLGMNRNEHVVWMIRRYHRREDMAAHMICFVILHAFLFTLVVLLTGIVTYSIFHQLLWTVLAPLLPFAVIFFLLLVIIGLLFVSIEAGSNRMTASFVMIFLVILDKFTVLVIPFMLHAWYRTMPMVLIMVLLLMIVLVTWIIRKQMQQLDYF